MNRLRHVALLFFIYAVLALPAAGVLLLYHYTQNPFLKPLGITREKLAELDGQTEFTSIFVHVDWGRDQTGTATKARLRQMISSSMNNRTYHYVFKFRDVPGDQIKVSFAVGANRYGPYPPKRMMDGIVPALAALKMLQKTNR